MWFIALCLFAQQPQTNRLEPIHKPDDIKTVKYVAYVEETRLTPRKSAPNEALKKAFAETPKSIYRVTMSIDFEKRAAKREIVDLADANQVKRQFGLSDSDLTRFLRTSNEMAYPKGNGVTWHPDYKGMARMDKTSINYNEELLMLGKLVIVEPIKESVTEGDKLVKRGYHNESFEYRRGDLRLFSAGGVRYTLKEYVNGFPSGYTYQDENKTIDARFEHIEKNPVFPEGTFAIPEQHRLNNQIPASTPPASRPS